MDSEGLTPTVKIKLKFYHLSAYQCFHSAKRLVELTVDGARYQYVYHYACFVFLTVMHKCH